MRVRQYLPRCIFAALLTSPCFAGSDALSSEPVLAPPAPQEDSWSYSIAPYAWLSGLEGQQGINGQIVDVDASFSDLWDVLDFAGFIAFEAQKGDWGYYADFQYLKLRSSNTTPIGFVADKVKLGLEQFHMKAGFKYRIYDTDTTEINLMAGAQYTYFSTELEIKGGPSAGSKNYSHDWIDPTLGIAFNYKFNEQWNTHIVAQVGGFGAASEITWEVLAAIGYQINDSWTAVGGYRHQYIDYARSGFVYDLDIGGPVIGAVYRF